MLWGAEGYRESPGHWGPTLGHWHMMALDPAGSWNIYLPLVPASMGFWLPPPGYLPPTNMVGPD